MGETVRLILNVSFAMTVKKVFQRGRVIVPFLLIAFLTCGGGGLFCPMATEAAPHHSQGTSLPSPATPSNNSDCPDQLKSSEAPSRDLTDGAWAFVQVVESANILKSPFSEYFFARSTPSSSTYPPLFLLFSVFLN